MEELSVNSGEYDANYWRKKSALFIAIHFQKYTRGKKCRKEAHRNIWVQYNRAAIIIQRYYRHWKGRRKYDEAKRERMLQNASQISRSQSSLGNLIQKAIAKKANYEDLVTLWRYVVELRRAHSSHGTNILLKSLIEAKSDLSRALILVGNLEFSLKNETDFSKTLKLQLLPTSCNGEADSYSDNVQFDGGGVRGIDVIRALRQRQMAGASGRAKNRSKSQLVDILRKSYYSRNHVGSAYGVKKYEAILSKK